MSTAQTQTPPQAGAYVPIPRRLDFDALAPVFSRAVGALDDAATAELDRTGIDAQLREFVRLRASQLNGCAYCVDVHTRAARTAGATSQRVHAVAIWEDSPFFTARERAALALTEAVTRLSETHVPPSVVTGALAHFSEEETAALLSLIIAINTWNAIGVATRCWTPQPQAD
ncbi:carboxymuconolactone decarboxylase family protein [Streptomyces avicenniae]|uniref:carboxymuconolactone decarboxylase family protein n=1 Tax=Streptomyces avicenniae TaxID=500153 RepID=UPI00069B5D23|nr:carboxymuconolactone decarboxylase family protein [Streptomyces avicenniae]